MTTKRTFSINQKIVKRAKRISRKRGKSISKIFEEYLTSLPEKDVAEERAIGKIKKVIKGKISRPDAHWKKVKEEQLFSKYGV